jgi:hypothetical protein
MTFGPTARLGGITFGSRYRERFKPLRPEDHEHFSICFPICGADFVPPRVRAKGRHRVLKGFYRSVGLDEDIHLASSEVVAVHNTISIRESKQKQIFQRDKRFKVGLRPAGPLQNEEVFRKYPVTGDSTATSVRHPGSLSGSGHE